MPQIYVACLASYNNGVLHGRWIDVDDVETMQGEIAEMLRESPYPNVTVECPECEGRKTRLVASCVSPDREPCPECEGRGTVPSAEEYEVPDYDGLPSSFGEHPDLAELVEYVEALDELHSDAEREAFRAWLDNDSTNKPDADAFREAYAGTFDSLADWAEDFMESTGGLHEVPERLRFYFDFDKYGRDADYGGDIWTSRGGHGLHVFWNH